MTATHPDTIWAAQYGNTIAAENNPGSLGGDGMEYISRAAHDAAVSAARKEGMLESLARVQAIRATTGKMCDGDEYGSGAVWACESCENAVLAVISKD